MLLPDLIVHADWSGSKASKRVAAVARLVPGDRYWIDVPRTVKNAGCWFERFSISHGTSDGATDETPGTMLVGFDFPIGFPAAYARRADIKSFRDALPRLGDGVWRDFFEVCRDPEEISLHRPFYPYRPGGRSPKQLTDALDIEWDDLRRECERKTKDRRAACPLFWTLGGNQVGKAALSGWREFVQPLLNQGDHVGLWPFDGPLVDLLQSRSSVIVETYPTEFYGHLGVRFGSGKGEGKQSPRARKQKRRVAACRNGCNGRRVHRRRLSSDHDGLRPQQERRRPVRRNGRPARHRQVSPRRCQPRAAARLSCHVRRGLDPRPETRPRCSPERSGHPDVNEPPPRTTRTRLSPQWVIHLSQVRLRLVGPDGCAAKRPPVPCGLLRPQTSQAPRGRSRIPLPSRSDPVRPRAHDARPDRNG
jgi:hypothetical protein